MSSQRLIIILFTESFFFWTLAGCVPVDTNPQNGDGPIAEGISARLGEPLPSATIEQVATFNRGKSVFLRKFDLSDGLGPAFNVVSCGACHERPTAGGSAGLYRNFFLAGRLANGFFEPSDSAGMAGGVLRVYRYSPDGEFRPAVPDTTTIFAQRNPIPMFGIGLFAGISDEEILSREDSTDADGDGISGRANIDSGMVGRFGRKAQTVSIEAFVRGPLFNHMGITTRPLTATQRFNLPFKAIVTPDTSSGQGNALTVFQVAAPETSTTDTDGISDPELSSNDLFDLINYVMLLAAPRLENPTTQSERGRQLFIQSDCAACHVPRLMGPSGPLHVYSDLLLHDMGDALGDGIIQNLASGNEFRTQPLWGLSAVGPYLHDGRAETIEVAILAHAGEALVSRNKFAALSVAQQSDVVEFLLSLGGRDQLSTGLLEPNTLIPDVGGYGGPFRTLTASEKTVFTRGRELYDRDFGTSTGIGALTGNDGGPRFNGDSCRACHFGPTIGGAGPRDVNVMRHGTISLAGEFTAPPDTPNTILHKQIVPGFVIPEASVEINVFEHRQTPHNFGLGLIDAITEATILSNADPNDSDADGISGRAHLLSDGRIGRLGWKANVPSLPEFVRDAMAAELGITLPIHTDLTFGLTQDIDNTKDPELTLLDVDDLVFFISMLAGPPRQTGGNTSSIANGEALFGILECNKCHIPTLPGALGDVPLYSDLLLHDILPAGSPGIVEGMATQTEFRTAPLWGLSQTAPYFHSGEADTIDEAIRLHDGEAATIRDTYLSLSATDKAALIAFLESL